MFTGLLPSRVLPLIVERQQEAEGAKLKTILTKATIMAGRLAGKVALVTGTASRQERAVYASLHRQQPRAL
jgi:hypothetical protein